MTTLSFPGSVTIGAGAAWRLPDVLEPLRVQRPLIVTGSTVCQGVAIRRVLEACDGHGLSPQLWSADATDPPCEDVERAAGYYRETACDGIVAIGGGSRLDLAKAVRWRVVHPDAPYPWFDTGQLVPPLPHAPPMVAIPTTAGSGSEVSRGAVLSDSVTRRKRLLAGPGMMFTQSILDPELSVSLPPALTAATGLDALCHALEVMASTGYHPIAEGLALYAATEILKWLPSAVADGANADVRQRLLVASACAAVGFTKGLGVIHALAQGIGGVCAVPHTTAIGILLPHGLRFNGSVCGPWYARVIGTITGGASWHQLPNHIQQWRLAWELPTRLSEVGVAVTDFEPIVARALIDHCLRSNPRPCASADLVMLLGNAF